MQTTIPVEDQERREREYAPAVLQGMRRSIRLRGIRAFVAKTFPSFQVVDQDKDLPPTRRASPRPYLFTVQDASLVWRHSVRNVAHAIFTASKAAVWQDVVIQVPMQIDAANGASKNLAHAWRSRNTHVFQQSSILVCEVELVFVCHCWGRRFMNLCKCHF